MNPNEVVNDVQPKSQKSNLNKAITVVMVVLIGTLAILYFLDNPKKFQLGKPSIDFSTAQHNFMPDTIGGYIGINKEWETAVLQPIVYGYATKDNKNYIQTAYLNEKDDPVYVDFVVTGEQDGKRVDDVWIKLKFKDGMFYSFEDMQKIIEVGSQIKIDYLEKIPTGQLTNPNFCNGLDRLCAISTFDDEYKVFSISMELIQ